MRSDRLSKQNLVNLTTAELRLVYATGAVQ